MAGGLSVDMQSDYSALRSLRQPHCIRLLVSPRFSCEGLHEKGVTCNQGKTECTGKNKYLLELL